MATHRCFPSFQPHSAWQCESCWALNSGDRLCEVCDPEEIDSPEWRNSAMPLPDDAKESPPADMADDEHSLTLESDGSFDAGA